MASLSQREADIQMMLAAQCHLGTKNCDFQMERYVYKRRNDGIYVIHLGKTWEKLQMAARVIVAIENPQDIVVQSARPYGQRAVLKFAQYTGSKALAGRHTPGPYYFFAFLLALLLVGCTQASFHLGLSTRATCLPV
jgi:small subunit ribosomal protein SAe